MPPSTGAAAGPGRQTVIEELDDLLRQLRGHRRDSGAVSPPGSQLGEEEEADDLSDASSWLRDWPAGRGLRVPRSPASQQQASECASTESAGDYAADEVYEVGDAVVFETDWKRGVRAGDTGFVSGMTEDGNVNVIVSRGGSSIYASAVPSVILRREEDLTSAEEDSDGGDCPDHSRDADPSPPPSPPHATAHIVRQLEEARARSAQLRSRCSGMRRALQAFDTVVTPSGRTGTLVCRVDADTPSYGRHSVLHGHWLVACTAGAVECCSDDELRRASAPGPGEDRREPETGNPGFRSGDRVRFRDSGWRWRSGVVRSVDSNGRPRIPFRPCDDVAFTFDEVRHADSDVSDASGAEEAPDDPAAMLRRAAQWRSAQPGGALPRRAEQSEHSGATPPSREPDGTPTREARHQSHLRRAAPPAPLRPQQPPQQAAPQRAPLQRPQPAAGLSRAALLDSLNQRFPEAPVETVTAVLCHHTCAGDLTLAATKLRELGFTDLAAEGVDARLPQRRGSGGGAAPLEDGDEAEEQAGSEHDPPASTAVALYNGRKLPRKRLGAVQPLGAVLPPSRAAAGDGLRVELIRRDLASPALSRAVSAVDGELGGVRLRAGCEVSDWLQGEGSAAWCVEVVLDRLLTCAVRDPFWELHCGALSIAGGPLATVAGGLCGAGLAKQLLETVFLGGPADALSAAVVALRAPKEEDPRSVREWARDVTPDELLLAFKRACLRAHPSCGGEGGSLSSLVATHMQLELVRAAASLSNSAADIPAGPSDAALVRELHEQGPTEAPSPRGPAAEVGMLRYLALLQSLRDSLEAHATKAKQRSAYTILGVSDTATDQEIRAAFRELAREHHPDRGGTKEGFRELRAAYEQILRERGSSGHAPAPPAKTEGAAEKPAAGGGKKPKKKPAAAGPPDGAGEPPAAPAEGGDGDGDSAAADPDSPRSDAASQAAEGSEHASQSAEPAAEAAAEGQGEGRGEGDPAAPGDSPRASAPQSPAASSAGEPSPPGSPTAPPAGGSPRQSTRRGSGAAAGGAASAAGAEGPSASAAGSSDLGEDGERRRIEEAMRAAELASECAQLVSRLRRAARAAPSRANLRQLALQALQLSLKTVSSLRTIGDNATAVARAVAPLAKWRPPPGTDAGEAAQLMSGQADLLQLTVRCQERSGEALRLAQEVPASLDGALAPLLALGSESSLLGEARMEMALERAARVVGDASSAALGAAMSAADVKMAADAFRKRLREWERRQERDTAEREERAQREEEIATAMREELRKREEAKRAAEEARKAAGIDSDDEDAKSDKGSDKGDEKASEAEEKDGDEASQRALQNRRMLRKLNGEVLRQQAAVKKLMIENAAAIPDVPVAEKTRLFTLVSELLDRRRRRAEVAFRPDAWARAVREAAELVGVASRHHQQQGAGASGVAVPSLPARLLRLAALVDLEGLCNLLESRLCAPLSQSATRSAQCENAEAAETRGAALRALREAAAGVRGLPLAP
eukprot:TRINITY_DN490_c0_g2_i1.p1 TRINITY_DN490_c0_g2~~TRINITY_DN490_c0_g2_i1.p1  ORF type:complete len:1522 (+),score=504.07 TRINITY_DN490_c0_g2_i1:98-4567(+)